MPLSIDRNEVNRRIAESIMTDNKALYEKSRPIEELIIPVRGIVQRVISSYRSGSFTPMSEARIGGGSSSYETGGNLWTEIVIESAETQIKRVKIHGNPSLEAKSNIRVYIFSGEEKEYRDYNKCCFGRGSNKETIDNEWLRKKGTVYIPRELKEKENAFIVQKTINNSSPEHDLILATFIDYDNLPNMQGIDIWLNNFLAKS